MNELLQRLRDRKLVQWVLAYIAAAFALIQVLDVVAQRFGWPESIERALIIALAIGFFVTLVLAWYHGEKGAQRIGSAELLLLALLLTIGGGAMWRVAQSPGESVASIAANANRHDMGGNAKSTQAAPVPEKSIAVLPFENLSDEKANGYFASGIQDEILTRLARIGALKVISRTSTMHFTSAPENLPQIAHQLGVANILEGSVQKAGDAVHINVQLIRAATDEHLWADSYNRKLDDIFTVEGEVAQTIAERLKATLTGAEEAQVNAMPTRNPAAYDAYLRGLDWERRAFGPEQLKEASSYFAQATQLDPDFSAAWSHGSDADGLLYFQAIDRSEARLEAARRGADNAMRLAPESSDAWLAKGWFLYHTEDFTGAEAAFAEAVRRAPNSPDIISAKGYLERRLGNYSASIQLLERSLDRDPQNVTNLSSLGETLDFIGRHNEARIWIDRALTVRPKDPAVLTLKGSSYLSEGKLDSAGSIFDPLPLQTDATSFNAQMTYLAYRRRFADVIKARNQAIAAPGFVLNGLTSWYYTDLAWAQRWNGDEAQARATFVEAKRKITELLATIRDNGYLAENLAMLEAGLGDGIAVEREGKRSLELLASA